MDWGQFGIGSALGGLGVGGMAGTQKGGIMDWLFGHSPEMQQASRFTPEQQGYQNQLLGGLQQPTSSGMDWLQQLLSNDPSAFADFEAPYQQQFQQETLPSIAERFAGMGSGGAQSSSGFQQTLGRAGKELSTSLAALRLGLKGQAIQQLQGFGQQAQQPSFENVYDPGSYGIVGGFAQGAGQGLGQAGSKYFLGA